MIDQIPVNLFNMINNGECSTVEFKTAKKNLPENLDVSMCSEVKLSHYDLRKFKELKFRDGARVCFLCVKNLPKNLVIENILIPHL